MRPAPHTRRTSSPIGARSRQRRWRLWLVASMLGLLAACGDDAASPGPPPRGPAVAEAPNTRLIEFKQRLQRDPYSADARFGLGMLLLERADVLAAEAELRQALELGMDPNVVLPPLARTWVMLGRSKALIDAHGNRQLGDAAASAEFRAALAAAYANTGNPLKARELVAAALQDNPTSARALVLEASVAMSDGKVDAALQSLEKALAAHPESTEAWEMKGDTLLMARGDRAAAVNAYEQALRTNPRQLSTHTRLIATALESNDTTTAQSRLDALVKVAPLSLSTLYFTARLAHLRGEMANARDLILQTLKRYPNDVRSLLLAGEIELKAGSPRTAEQHLASAFALAPRVARTRHLLAQTYLQLGMPDKAQLVLEPLVRSEVPDATALGLAAEAALQSGLTSVAARLFARASAADPPNPRYRTAIALGRIAKGEIDGGFDDLQSIAKSDRTIFADMALLSARLRSGNVPAAIKAAEGVVAKQPDKPLPHWLLGKLKLKARNVDDARRHFARAYEIAPTFVPAAVSLAELDLSERKPELAKARFDAVLRLDPRNQDALLAMADIRRRAGEPDAGITQALEAVVQMHPDHPRPRLALIKHLQQSGDAAAALLAAQSATQALPRDLDVVEALGDAQLAAGESAQALGTFRLLVSARPRSAAPHLRMADIYMSRNEIDSAIDEARQALILEPRLLAAQVKLAGLATVKKQWREALTVARDVQRSQPQDPQGFHLEGLVHAAQLHWDLALASFRAAMQRGESAELALRYHGALLAAGKRDEATSYASRWLAARPLDTAFVAYLGDVALMNQDFAGAEGHYRALLKVKDRQVDAMNNLAWVLYKQGKPEALTWARRAAELQPARADVLDTLSLALARNNQLAAALENQKKAVQLDAKSPVLRLHLARLAVDSGDHVLARAQLDQLSALGNAFGGQAEVWQLRQRLR